MTLDQIELELKRLSTKEDLANLRAEIHKDFGDFKTDLFKFLMQVQFSTIAVILIGVGLIVHFKP